MSIVFNPKVLALENEMIKNRRYIHQNPELGFEEENTSKFIEQQLQSYGLQPIRIAKTGIMITIPGKSNKVLGFRADIDALPVQEVSGREYGSKNPEKHHACGHDAHTAILLGLAKYYSSFEIDKRPGTIKLFFQPAEEGPGGAKPMVEAGAMENPTPDAVVALHVGSDYKCGTINIRENESHASSDAVKIIIRGKGGHGAEPHKAIDPVPVAAEIILALQRIISRESDPLEPLVLTIGTLEGGFRHNIIAPEVTMTGTLRTFNNTLREKIKLRVKELVEKQASLHGCIGIAEWGSDGYGPGFNDPELTRLIINAAKKSFSDLIYIPEHPIMGSEDFFEFGSTSKPVAMFSLGCRNESKGVTAPHHSPEFDVDEECFKYGLQTFINIINEFFITKQ